MDEPILTPLAYKSATKRVRFESSSTVFIGWGVAISHLAVSAVLFFYIVGHGLDNFDTNAPPVAGLMMARWTLIALNFPMLLLGQVPALRNQLILHVIVVVLTAVGYGLSTVMFLRRRERRLGAIPRFS